MQKNNNESTSLITQKELCEWLSITPMTAYRWRKKGMPHLGQGKGLRYRKSDIIQWLEEVKEE